MKKQTCETCKFFVAHYFKFDCETYIKLEKCGHCICEAKKIEKELIALSKLKNSKKKLCAKKCEFWQPLEIDELAKQKRYESIKTNLMAIEIMLSEIQYSLLENEVIEEENTVD